jgi:hypothetical protein
MTKIHIISDLSLGFNEFADSVDETMPDVDLVILNGNIGMLKRGMLYAENLARKYPDIPFVYNLGYLEKYHFSLEKYENETEENIELRIKVNNTWPTNLHYSQNNMVITCKNGFQVDIVCKFGYPKIHQSNINWKDSFYHRNIGAEFTYFENDERILRPKDTSNVGHGNYPIWATIDWVNKQHEAECSYIRNWENKMTHYKILVTHINPYIDTRNEGLVVSPHKIHLNDMLWVTSQTKVENVKFLGARLVSNPGRGILPRSHVVNI